MENLPDTFEVDWRAAVLNGDSWWNTGSSLMLWSGGNNEAAGAALHEGGHGFHQLADEYGDCSSSQVNVTDDNMMAEGKWDLWLDFDQQPGTAMQGFFECQGSGKDPYRIGLLSNVGMGCAIELAARKCL